jgi:hypothetical protein
MLRHVLAAIGVVVYLTMVFFALSPAPAASSTQSAPLSPKEAAGILVPSLAHLSRDKNDRCTAFKVAPAAYLTAGHCVETNVSRDFLRVGSRRLFIRRYIKPSDPKDDWTIIKTGYNDPSLRAINVGCDEKIYLGMPVAYAGYPSPLDLTMVMGRVISILPTRGEWSRSDFVLDTPGNRGVSGSPVISLNTGNVIGIVIEGLGDRTHRYAMGVNSIKNTSLCREVATTVNSYQ